MKPSTVMIYTSTMKFPYIRLRDDCGKWGGRTGCTVYRNVKRYIYIYKFSPKCDSHKCLNSSRTRTSNRQIKVDRGKLTGPHRTKKRTKGPSVFIHERRIFFAKIVTLKMTQWEQEL